MFQITDKPKQTAVENEDIRIKSYFAPGPLLLT